MTIITPRIEQLATSLTVSTSFEALCNAQGGYRPTLRPDLGPEDAELADAYDAYQAARGDVRRAFRG